MSFSKAHKFSKSIYHFSIVCKAMSHPARIMLVKNVLDAERGILKFKDVIKDIPLNPSTITQHLKFLRDMNIMQLVNHKGVGYYKLNYTLEQTIYNIIAFARMAELEENHEYLDEIELIERNQGVRSVD